MSKDFAKKSKKGKSASRLDSQKTPNPIPVWIWLLAGLIFGVFATVFLYIQYQPTAVVKPVSKVESKPPSAKSRYKAVPAEEVSESEFNYHNDLENKTIEVTVEEPLPDSKAEKRKFIMQCGSFRKEASAEKLRAQIALTGFEATIKETIEKNGLWHRVVLGPYSSKRVAERERHQLQRNNINNCQIW